MRGHGDSTRPADGQFAWSGFADDVLAVVDGFRLDLPIGVGHSKGGAALVLAEARKPGTFRSLWLFEPVIFPPSFAFTGENPLAAGARRRRSRFDSWAAAEANFSAKPPLDVLSPEALREYVTHGFALQPDGSVELKCRPEDEAQVFEMAGQSHAWEVVEQIGCPVTVVRGARSTPGPASFADDLAVRFPHGTLEAHEELGHFGPLEDPEAMARSVLASLVSAPPT